MTRSGDRRHLIWLALGVLVPGAVLLAFGSLLVMQETELERRRAADAEALWSRSVADSLQRGLEHALAGISWDGEARRYPADTPLLSLGAVVQGRYEPVRPAPPDAWGDRGFDRMQRQTDRQFAQRNFSGALEAFRRQLGRETDSTRIAMLHHLTARAAFAIGDTATAVEAATKALETPAYRTDQFGLPIAFFSAELLVLQGLAELEVCDVLGRSLAGMAWISPSAFSYAADLGQSAECGTVPEDIASEYALLEWLESQSVTPVSSGDRTISNWRTVPGNWLVRYAERGVNERQPIVAIRVDSLERIISIPGVLAFGLSQAEHSGLGPLFPSLAVSTAPEARPRVSRAMLVGGGLLLILAMTVFGGLLVLRDIRREARLSKLRNQFVSSVSHEVRTPLTSIRLFAEAMLEYGAGDAQQVRKNLEVIAYESGRLTRMLNNVLETSRIERGSVRYTLTSGDLREPVLSAVDALRYAFDRSGVPLSVQAESVDLSFDPDAVQQAVVNLLSNALKYGEGSPVEVRSDSVADGGIISVRDGGPGIAIEEQADVFERFVQGRNAGDSAGVGLGLALVRHIMEGHGGTVTLESRPGHGSLFTLHFPHSG